MKRIIKMMAINGDDYQLEVISDIGGPEEISPDSLELFFPLFQGMKVDLFHAPDLRDHLQEADKGVGLRHAECLMKIQWKIPKEWEEKFLFFPGTILRGMISRDLFMPFMEFGYYGWGIRIYPIWCRDWSRDLHYFVRWKK